LRWENGWRVFEAFWNGDFLDSDGKIAMTSGGKWMGTCIGWGDFRWKILGKMDGENGWEHGMDWGFKS
jgi:hypothetical protein